MFGGGLTLAQKPRAMPQGLVQAFGKAKGTVTGSSPFGAKSSLFAAGFGAKKLNRENLEAKKTEPTKTIEKKPERPKPWINMLQLQDHFRSLTVSTVDSVEQYILSVPEFITEEGASKVITELAFIGFECGEEAACLDLVKRLYARKEFEAVFLDSLLQVRHPYIMKVVATFTRKCYNMKLFDIKTLIAKVQSVYASSPEKREIIYYIYVWFAPEFDIDRKLSTSISHGMKTSASKYITNVAESIEILKANNWSLYKDIENGNSIDVMEQIIAEDDVESLALIGTQYNFNVMYKASSDWRDEERTLIQLAIKHKASKCLRFLYDYNKDDAVKSMKSDIAIARSLEMCQFAAKNDACVTSILYNACLLHRMDVFKWVLFHKFNKIKFTDQTPSEYLLDACTASNNIRALSLLISMGFEYTNIASPKSLYTIINKNKIDIFKMVVDMKGLRLSETDPEKGSAAEYAIRLGRQEFATILLEEPREVADASKLMHVLIDMGNHTLLEKILARKDVNTAAVDQVSFLFIMDTLLLTKPLSNMMLNLSSYLLSAEFLPKEYVYQT